MSDDNWKTLFHPVERGLIAAPEAGEHWIYSGAAPGFVLPDGFAPDLTCVQPWRPAFLTLEKQGYAVQPEVGDGVAFDGALVLLGGYRDDNFLRLRQAALAVKRGGTILVAGGKTDGIAPLRKHLQAHLPELESVSKHHGVALWFEVPEAGLEEVLPRPGEPVRFGNLTIPPGVFSADGPDPASVMLAECFDGRLKGRVADFGAGWGYLGAQALERCPEITSLWCYEAHWRSAMACERNLRPLAEGKPLDCRWFDLLSEETGEKFDCVVMNPPFHDGRAARPEIGIGFIEVAARALKPGGRLLMVANRNLPYEAVLAARFRRAERLAEAGGFKVIEALR